MQQYVSLDLSDKRFFTNTLPHGYFCHMRQREPVSFTESIRGNFWSLFKHADIITASQDPETYCSHIQGAMFADPDTFQLMVMNDILITMKLREHDSFRRLLHAPFTPRAVQRLSAGIRDEAQKIVVAAVEKHNVEFVHDVASILPNTAISMILGIPKDDWAMVADWANDLVLHANDFMNAGDTLTNILAYAGTIIAEKRAHPDESLMSIVAHCNINGTPITDFQAQLFFMFLSVAGNETTRTAISHGTRLLCENPSELQKLYDNHDLLPTALEEMLRCGTPVIQFRRTTTKDVILSGQHIPANSKIIMWYASANYDEDVFDCPYTFDIERNPNHHLSFGMGRHFCMGTALARLQLHAIFQELLTRTSGIEITGPLEGSDSLLINAIEKMPVRLTPA